MRYSFGLLLFATVVGAQQYVISTYAGGNPPPTVGGIQATVQYAGGAAGQAVGVMRINVQIPNGVQPGGYVPVVLQVGNVTTTPGAVWIAVSRN